MRGLTKPEHDDLRLRLNRMTLECRTYNVRTRTWCAEFRVVAEDAKQYASSPGTPSDKQNSCAYGHHKPPTTKRDHILPNPQRVWETLSSNRSSPGHTGKYTSYESCQFERSMPGEPCTDGQLIVDLPVNAPQYCQCRRWQLVDCGQTSETY